MACFFLSVGVGLLPPPHAITLIRIRQGQLEIRRCQMRPHAKGQVLDVLKDSGISKGFIALTPGNRVMFSLGMPEKVKQRLRNVILNQWV